MLETEPPGLGSCSRRISMREILQWELNVVDYVAIGFDFVRESVFEMK